MYSTGAVWSLPHRAEVRFSEMIPAGKVPLSSSWGPEMTRSSPAQGHTAKTRGGVGVGLELKSVGEQG